MLRRTLTVPRESAVRKFIKRKHREGGGQGSLRPGVQRKAPWATHSACGGHRSPTGCTASGASLQPPGQTPPGEGQVGQRGQPWAPCSFCPSPCCEPPGPILLSPLTSSPGPCSAELCLSPASLAPHRNGCPDTSHLQSWPLGVDTPPPGPSPSRVLMTRVNGEGLLTLQCERRQSQRGSEERPQGPGPDTLGGAPGGLAHMHEAPLRRIGERTQTSHPHTWVRGQAGHAKAKPSDRCNMQITHLMITVALLSGKCHQLQVSGPQITK